MPASMEVDWRLAIDLAPDHIASKVIIEPRSPARKVGLRSGDYVVSISPSAMEVMSLGDFDAGNFPVGLDAFVRFHRPGENCSGKIQTVIVRLGKRPRVPIVPPWQQMPRVAFGPEVARNDRARFEAQMTMHPLLPHLGFRILVRLVRYYDGPKGAFPSYATLARDVGCERRAAINQINRLEWLGIVEARRRAGVKGIGGTTNLYVIHWPERWGPVVKLSV